MSPDSAETRIRQLETAVAALQSQHADHERDIRQYAPSLIEIARFGERMNSTAAEIRVIGASVTDLRAEWRRDVDHFNHEVEAVRDEVAAVRKQQADDKLDLEKHRSQREEKEREREKVDRRWRVTTAIAIGGLLVTTIGLAITVLTLINHAPKP